MAHNIMEISTVPYIWGSAHVVKSLIDFPPLQGGGQDERPEDQHDAVVAVQDADLAGKRNHAAQQWEACSHNFESHYLLSFLWETKELGRPKHAQTKHAMQPEMSLTASLA